MTSATKTIPTLETKQDILNFYDDMIGETERDLRSFDRVLLGHGYVIECGGLHVSFDVEPDTRMVINPHVAPLMQCRRLTRRDAEKLAPDVKNAAGDTGTAIHIVDALKKRLASLQQTRAEVAARREAKSSKAE